MTHPTFTLNFGCNWQQPIPWFGDFHSIQCPISASCLATAVSGTYKLPLHSVPFFMYLHCYDRHYSEPGTFYVVLSRCCIYFGVKNRIFYGSLKKKVLTVCYFFQRRPIHQVIGSKEKKNIDFHHSPLVLVYAFHLVFVTLFGFTSMHVQISVNMFLNRFVCCSKEKNVKTEGRDYRKMIFVLL